MDQKLDFSFLKKAIHSLGLALEQPKNDFIRDSVIQRFEYTYELSWKILKRYFAWNQQLEEANIKNLFREAGRQGLIDSVELWFQFHKARNETSHTYQLEKAEEIYLLAKTFFDEVKKLLEKLEKLTK